MKSLLGLFGLLFGNVLLCGMAFVGLVTVGKWTEAQALGIVTFLMLTNVLGGCVFWTSLKK